MCTCGGVNRAALGMRAGKCLWRARGYQSTPPAVRGALFTPDAAAPDVLVTLGTTHVRFWQGGVSLVVSHVVVVHVESQKARSK